MGRYLFQRMCELKQVWSISKMCLGFFFLFKKKGVLGAVCSLGYRYWALFVPRDQGNTTQGRCVLMCLQQARCSHTLYQPRKLLNLMGSVTRTCISWHLENETQSKSKQIMKQDVMHSTDNKIRSFEKWQTGLFLL